jgi:nitroimidazol reductase NimA-like FMN-containing flavoprotein (pyridoxamine 5'-phosphate oxidase superfamily)
VKAVPLERRGDYLVTMDVLEEEVCRQLLDRCHFGRLAFDDTTDGLTVLPVNCLHADGVVLFRAQAGSALDRVGYGRAVAFEADHTDAVAESGWSVLVRGVATHLRDPERISALGDTASHPWAPGGHDHWIEIHPQRITGRIIQRDRLVSDAVRVPYMAPA